MRIKSKIDLWVSITIWSVLVIVVGTLIRFDDQTAISYSIGLPVTTLLHMLSSMALSGDRIEIKQHGKGYLLGTTYISPENREQFLSELISRCKNLNL